MSKPEVSTFFEIAGLIIIRIACLALCLYFFLPLFTVSKTLLDTDLLKETQVLTGFNTIFGVKGSGVYGNPFALVAFLFPIALLIGSAFLSFLNEHMYTTLFISSIIGFILSIIYFIATVTFLNQKESLFDFTLYEMKTGLSWGVLLILGTYLLIIAMSLLGKRNCET